MQMVSSCLLCQSIFFYSNKKNRNGEGDGGEDVKGKYLVEAHFFRPLSNQ